MDDAIKCFPESRVFELVYETVRVDSSDPNQTYFFFPLRQLRKITKDTPLPPRRKHDRDCLVAVSDNRINSKGTVGPVKNAKICGDAVSFKGTRVGPTHARLIIPILIKPGTSEYAVPPNGTLKSFDDLEIWLTEFFKKFVLRPGDSPSVMQFRSASPTQELQTEARMTYEIEGVNVQSWSTIEEARSFFAIFAPPRIPLSVIKAHLVGLEESLSLSPWTPRNEVPLTAVEENHLGKFLLLTASSTSVNNNAALVSLCSQPESNEEENGKRLIMLSTLLRKCSPDILSLEGVKDSPLICAVKARNHTFIRVLLDHGANIASYDGELRSPLHHAARAGDSTALRLLLDHGKSRPTSFNVNPIDCNRRTPLMDAAEALSIEGVRLLLQCGANPGARDHVNETALHRLVCGGFDQTIAMELVTAGCPLAAVNNFGISACSLAAQKLVVFNIPQMEKITVDLPILDLNLDFSFSTARHRSSQGAITLNVSRAERRPIFEYQFGLTIHTKSETYVQLRPSSGWMVPTRNPTSGANGIYGTTQPYCRCEGSCKTCACIRLANRGSMVFNSRGILLPNFPEKQPIVMCTAFCRCSKICPLRSLSDSVGPRMEIFQDLTRKSWMVKTLDELERGQFVTFLGGEIIHPDYMEPTKPYRYLLFSRIFSVDVSRKANCSRFFADSINPNLRVVMVKEFDHNKPPQIAFFASEWIAKGEELSYDKSRSFEIVQQVLRDQCFSEYRFDDRD